MAIDESDGHNCTGVAIRELAVDVDGEILIDLAQALGCPSCGHTGKTWVIPPQRNQIQHRRGEPGE